WCGGGDSTEALSCRPAVRVLAAPPVSDLSSQRRLRLSPVRITVYPRGLVGPRTNNIDVYPRAYPYDWPGPFARRECIGWLAAEARPSGPVIVPHRRGLGEAGRVGRARAP